MQTLKLTKKYEKYPEYKDSGVEWLGKIPKDWKHKKLKTFFSLSNERVADSPDVTTILSVSGYRGVEIRKNIETSDGQMPSENVDAYRIVRKNQLVINTMWLNFTGLGVSSYEGYVSPAYRAYNISKEMVPKYVNHLMRSDTYVQKYSSLLYGLRPNSLQVKPYDFEKIEILYPDINEQKRISKYLDEKTSYIDEVIKKKEKQIELLKEEIVSIAQGEQMNGKGETIRMRELFKLAETPIELEDYSEYVALGLYNRGRGLFHKEPQLGKDIKESDFYKVKPRDLIISGQFAWEGAVALASKDENECVVSHRYYLLRNGVIKTEYLLALLMTKFGDHILNESSRGSAGRNRPLNIKILLKEKIRVPSKEVETKIESLLIKMNSIIDNIKKSISLMEEYKSSLISSVVTGKIKV